MSVTVANWQLATSKERVNLRVEGVLLEVPAYFPRNDDLFIHPRMNFGGWGISEDQRSEQRSADQS